MKFEVSLAGHLEPGEHVRAGVMGRAGSSPSITPIGTAFDQLAAGESGGRMLVLTDRRMILARTSTWWGWRVKRVVSTYPLATPIQVRDEGLGALIEVLDEIRVHTNRAGKPWAEDLVRQAREAG